MAGEMTELKHTPTPWTKNRSARLCGANGRAISLSDTGIGLSSGARDPQSEIDGEFVLTAINNYDEMGELLRELAADLKIELDARYSGCLEWPSQKRRYDNDMEPVIKARALLTRMEGKEG